jgi:hypothetical protein
MLDSFEGENCFQANQTRSTKTAKYRLALRVLAFSALKYWLCD